MGNARRLGRNLILLLGGEATAKILGFLAFGWLGRCLGDAAYGELESALALVFVLALVQEAGLAPYGAREAAKDPSKTSRLAARIGVARLGLAVVAYGLLAAIVLLFPRGERPDRLILLAGLILLPAPFLLNWAFEARDRMGVVAASSLIRQSILAGTVFLFVRDAADGWLQPVADAAGLAAAVLVQQVLHRRDGFGYDPSGLVAGAREDCARALPMAASTIAWALRVFLPMIALFYLGTASETGRFAAGHRLVISGHSFCWLYFVNLLPTLSRQFAADDREAVARTLRGSMRLVAYTVLPGCALAAALGPTLLPGIFGPEFKGAGRPFGTAIWMLGAAFISGHARYTLIAVDGQKAEFLASLAGAVVSIAALAFHHDALTAEVAAGIFVASEVTTLAFAGLFLTRALGPLGLLGPALRAGVLVFVSVWLTPRPIAGAALAILLCALVGWRFESRSPDDGDS